MRTGFSPRWGILLLAACASASSHGSAPSWTEAPLARLFSANTAGIRYNEMSHPSVHNAYADSASIHDQLEGAGVRSLELDLHTGKRGRGRIAGDWYVYHVDFPLLDGTRCARFTECMDVLADFHRKNPRHQPITVFLDMKDPFDGEHRPEQLDAVIASRLPTSIIMDPSDLVRRCPAAEDVNETLGPPCGWPEVGELDGMFVFALTGGSACSTGGRLREYAPDPRVAATRLGFIAPSITDECKLADYAAAAPFVVFFNLDWAHREAARLIKTAGAVARIYAGDLYGALDDGEMVAALEGGLGTFLVTDRLGLDKLVRPRQVAAAP